MRIQVKVNTSSSKQSVEIVDGIYLVKFQATREKGKANKKLIKIMSNYFDIPKSQIEIAGGHHSNHKILNIQRD